jgi:hypothetical protein
MAATRLRIASDGPVELSAEVADAPACPPHGFGRRELLWRRCGYGSQAEARGVGLSASALHPLGVQIEAPGLAQSRRPEGGMGESSDDPPLSLLYIWLAVLEDGEDGLD